MTEFPSDNEIINACETIRKTYLRLDNDVMPFKERINNGQYYGKLRIKLLTLVKMSEMKIEERNKNQTQQAAGGN